MTLAITQLKSFRNAIYSCFPKRKDAIFDLLDALTSHAHQCKSVIELSQANSYQRQYSSITDAIADGLPFADWDAIQTLVYQSSPQQNQPKRHCFVLDCTPNPRPFAHKLDDRTITHAPNPAPGNKPICVGHQYSVLALYPGAEAAMKHWLVPLSAKRVSSSEKGNEMGMKQLLSTLEQLELTEELNVSVADSLYGTQNCRTTASQADHLVHIFRLNSRRNVFCSPGPSVPTTAGRHKEFGDKVILQDESTYPNCDEESTASWITSKGRSLQVTMKCWDDMLLRGSRTFRSSQHPITVIQIKVKDENNKALFKRPLLLAVCGKRRKEVRLEEAYHYYRQRYDIEHFFRFGKNKLLMSAYQTPDVGHEENWWQLCLLAYAQLKLSSSMVSMLPKPWERYLPEYQEHRQGSIATPAQTQRGFARVLSEIGSPAVGCTARGKPCGRVKDELMHKRENQKVLFKAKKKCESSESQAKSILSGCDKRSSVPEPQTIEQLLEYVQKQLDYIEYSPPHFAKMLLKAGKK